MKTVKPLLAAAGVAILLAGCGSSNPSANTSASASTSASDSTSASANPSPQSFAADAYKHAACMRSHGLPDFPDPQIVNTPTTHQIRQALPLAVASSPGFKAAQEACKGIIPGPKNEAPAQQASEQRAHAQYLLAFAQCLRAHGIAGFPDPNAQGQLTLAMIHAAGVDLQAPSILPAARACVGITHGAITYAQVEEAIRHPSGPQSTGGSESSGGGQ
jgi:hypothetical protein